MTGTSSDIDIIEIEMEKLELPADLPDGAAARRKQAHGAGKAAADRLSVDHPLGLLALVDVDAQGVMTRALVANLTLAVLPLGEGFSMLQVHHSLRRNARRAKAVGNVQLPRSVLHR
ncbi:hypothetical protein [Marinobacter nauticus]